MPQALNTHTYTKRAGERELENQILHKNLGMEHTFNPKFGGLFYVNHTKCRLC